MEWHGAVCRPTRSVKSQKNRSRSTGRGERPRAAARTSTTQNQNPRASDFFETQPPTGSLPIVSFQLEDNAKVLSSLFTTFELAATSSIVASPFELWFPCSIAAVPVKSAV